MSSPYLTDEEIAVITHPLRQGAARVRYLRDVYGLLVKPRPDGQPVVARVEWDAAMLAKKHRDRQEGPPRTERPERPKFECVRGFKTA